MRELFGTDGVRGVANHDLTVHLCLRIARAAATELRREGQRRPTVILGRDTRLSGDMIEAAMLAGFCSAGADVISVGVIPTAGIAYLARVLDVDMGAVISASHNPYEFNGIKFFSHQGFKLPDSVEQSIETRVKSTEHLDHPSGEDLGRRLDAGNSADLYADYLRELSPRNRLPLRVAIDGANGAASQLAPTLFGEMVDEVITLNCDPDGVNINTKCGATHPEVVARAVLEHKADIGLTFDGDADRLLVSDELGRVVNGDRILAMTAKSLLDEDKLPGNIVVGTVMSNLGLEMSLQKLGITLVRTKVGDRYVLEEMQRLGSTLGGEQSGHVIFLEHATTGDGLLTAIMLMRLLEKTGEKLSNLADIVEEFPQRLTNIPVASPSRWSERADIQRAISAAEQDLGEEGRVLVRASGTEPLIRVMVEASRAEKVEYWSTHIAQVISDQLAA